MIQGGRRYRFDTYPTSSYAKPGLVAQLESLVKEKSSILSSLKGS
jgi:hypothetical protein